MAFLGGLLGGGGSDPMDIYGDLFTEKQRAALRDQQMTQGLLNAAAVFSKAGQASRLPQSIPWGEAAQALGGSGDEAMARMLKGMQVAEEVRSSRQQREVLAKAAPYVEAIMKQFGLDLPTATKVATRIASAQGGAPAGGQPAPNTPPPAPPSMGLPPAGMSPFGLPDTPAALPMPPAPPGGRITPADYGVPNPQSGLLGTPPDTPQGEGLLAGMPPFGQGSQGSPDLSNIKIEQLSGEAAPAGGREGRVAFWTAQGAPQHVAEGIADRVKAESGFNPSIMGDQGTSGGLYQHHADRLARLKGFAAQQGRSWTDPGVQDQFAATEVRGGDAIAAKGWPAILNAPDRQTAATLWDKYFERSAAGPGSGGGGRTAGIRIEQLGGDAVPAGAGGGPQTLGGVRPEALAALNAMLKMGGIKSDPFGSLLETYYKSPAYLEEKTKTETKARTDIEDPLNQRMKVLETMLKMRQDGILYNPETGEIKADPQWDKIHDRRADQSKALELDYAKRLKTFEEQQKIEEEIRKDQKEIAPQPIFRGGVIVEQPMTREAAVQRLKDQSMRPGEYRDGDIVAKPIGNLSPDHQYKMSPTGGLTVEPIAGTPGAEKAADLARNKAVADRQMLAARDVVVQDANRIESMVNTSAFPVTGLWGSILSSAPGTPQHDTAVAIKGIEDRTSMNAINQARAASGSTGLGQITMGEHAILASAIGALKQSQSKESFLFNLRRVKDEYINAVYGPAFHGTMPKETTVVPTPKSDVVPAGAVPTGQFHQGKPVYKTPDGKLGTFQ